MGHIHIYLNGWENLDQLKTKVLLLQKAVSVFRGETFRSGEAVVLLGGSAVNGHSGPNSDLDGGFYPMHLKNDARLKNHIANSDEATQSLFARMSSSIITFAVGGRQLEQAWTETGILSETQPFMIRITATRVTLVYFPPQWKEYAEQDPTHYKEYVLDWQNP